MFPSTLYSTYSLNIYVIDQRKDLGGGSEGMVGLPGVLRPGQGWGGQHPPEVFIFYETVPVKSKWLTKKIRRVRISSSVESITWRSGLISGAERLSPVGSPSLISSRTKTFLFFQQFVQSERKET